MLITLLFINNEFAGSAPPAVSVIADPPEVFVQINASTTLLCLYQIENLC